MERNKLEVFDERRNFTEAELWYIANSIINTDLALGREGGSYHGNI